MRWRSLAGSCCLVAVAACTGGGPPRTSPPPSGAVRQACGAFDDLLVTTRPGEVLGNTAEQYAPNSIVLLHPDGSTGRVLTDPKIEASNPSLSPDGGRVVFEHAVGVTDSGANAQVLSIVSIDGGTADQVTGPKDAERTLTDTHHPGPSDESPDWSPVEDEIAFSRRELHGKVDSGILESGILVLHLGHWPHFIVGPDINVEYSAPTWSPDGRHLAYVRSDPQRTGLWVVDRDGSHAHRVADFDDAGATSFDVAWSSSGTAVFVASTRGDPGGFPLLAIRTQTGRIERLAARTAFIAVTSRHAYSFTRTADGLPQLIVATVANGSLASVRRVTTPRFSINVGGLDAIACRHP